MGPPPSATDFPSFHDVDPFPDTFRCVYYLVNKSRGCGNKIDKRLRITTSGIKREIEIETSVEKRSALLLEFISNCCCKRDHRQEVTGTLLAESLRQRWEAELPSLPESTESGVSSAPESQTNTIPTSFESHTKSSSAVVDRPRVTSRPHLRSDGPVTEATQADTGEGRSKTTFVPFIKKPGDTLAGNLCEPLGAKQDLKPGSIYIFSKEASFEMVKIGHSINLKDRMRSIRGKCGYTPDLKYWVNNVPHASRAERLVHYELLYCWHIERGCMCGVTRHMEWFKCSVETAIRIMKNFSRWMEEAEPYDMSAGGTLKPEWSSFIQMLEREGRQITSQLLLDEMERRRSQARASIMPEVNVPVVPLPSTSVPPQPRPEPQARSTAPLLSPDAENMVMAAVQEVLSSNTLQGTAMSLASLIQRRLRALESTTCATGLGPLSVSRGLSVASAIKV
ncbi:hypothetical protein LTR84_010122 [Exophiala bonariae]|uniref:Bacteriophage T5 Orf172 DNA-binding domain-containing protein n=1 Tax=Exophiala bonariae TaxID=1690606 RepID=A0AAV9NLW9_9EURO|nr:hypothetical protein LTR84_010122 [Exophiala bonariae]